MYIDMYIYIYTALLILGGCIYTVMGPSSSTIALIFQWADKVVKTKVVCSEASFRCMFR